MHDLRHGPIFLSLGVLHTLLAISPWAFGTQFSDFAVLGFFKISDGLLEFPLLHGTMNYENFAAFWFFYYGPALLLLGILVNHLERHKLMLPRLFTLSYLGIVGVGAYMIPLSGMTFLMLPHALVLAWTNRNKTGS